LIRRYFVYAHQEFSFQTKYSDEGLIKPAGTAIASDGTSNFYHPRQAAELKKKIKE
jgi:hypothetical protein